VNNSTDLCLLVPYNMPSYTHKMAIVNRFCDVTSPYAFRTHYFYTVHMLTIIADIGNKSVPIQLAQCRFPRLAISNAKILIYFSNTEAILSNSTRKLLWFEIIKCWLQFKKEINFIVWFIIIIGTLSFPIDRECVTLLTVLKFVKIHEFDPIYQKNR